jgi:signal transduction histidine kinase
VNVMMDVMSQRPTRLPAPDGTAEVVRAGAAAYQLIVIVTVFWIYVTVSNLLYMRSLSAGIDPSGVANFFASSEPRLLQHAFLYPLLLACLWASVRVGWRPLWRSIPLQLLLSVVFAISATPLLAIAENVVTADGWRVPQDIPGILAALFSGTRWSLWIAGATKFELTYGFALALVTGFVLYRRFRDAELRVAAAEREWSDARLGALRAQLSPHTLFNLLHTIRGQIAWDPAAAQAMVVRLGDLLRTLLSAGEREFTLLQDEVRFAQLYLELQQQRFEDRVKLSLPTTNELPAVWIPSLILQPLIENAVVHGLAGHEGEVTIGIQVTSDNGMLIIRVTNSMQAQNESSRGGGGIGLRNVRERLAVHFGNRAGMSSGSHTPELWATELRLPLLPLDENDPPARRSIR